MNVLQGSTSLRRLDLTTLQAAHEVVLALAVMVGDRQAPWSHQEAVSPQQRQQPQQQAGAAASTEAASLPAGDQHLGLACAVTALGMQAALVAGEVVSLGTGKPSTGPHSAAATVGTEACAGPVSALPALPRTVRGRMSQLQRAVRRFTDAQDSLFALLGAGSDGGLAPESRAGLSVCAGVGVQAGAPSNSPPPAASAATGFAHHVSATLAAAIRRANATGTEAHKSLTSHAADPHPSLSHARLSGADGGADTGAVPAAMAALSDIEAAPAATTDTAAPPDILGDPLDLLQDWLVAGPEASSDSNSDSDDSSDQGSDSSSQGGGDGGIARDADHDTDGGGGGTCMVGGNSTHGPVRVGTVRRTSRVAVGCSRRVVTAPAGAAKSEKGAPSSSTTNAAQLVGTGHNKLIPSCPPSGRVGERRGCKQAFAHLPPQHTVPRKCSNPSSASERQVNRPSLLESTTAHPAGGRLSRQPAAPPHSAAASKRSQAVTCVEISRQPAKRARREGASEAAQRLLLARMPAPPDCGHECEAPSVGEASTKAAHKEAAGCQSGSLQVGLTSLRSLHDQTRTAHLHNTMGPVKSANPFVSACLAETGSLHNAGARQAARRAPMKNSRKLGGKRDSNAASSDSVGGEASSDGGWTDLEDFIVCQPGRDYAALLAARFRHNAASSDEGNGDGGSCDESLGGTH